MNCATYDDSNEANKSNKNMGKQLKIEELIPCHKHKEKRKLFLVQFHRRYEVM